MAADPAPEFPRLLEIRLTRAPASLSASFAVGAFLTGFAALGWAIGHYGTTEKNDWLIDVICAGFGFFGLLVLWAWFRQMLMRRVPEPIVEISQQPFRVGGRARIALIQRGPAKLRSLRANLVCLEQRSVWRESSDGTSYRDVTEKLLSTRNLCDETSLVVPRRGRWHTVQDFIISEEARPSRETSDYAILWRIELWAKGSILGSFWHRYPVEVAAQ